MVKDRNKPYELEKYIRREKLFFFKVNLSQNFFKAETFVLM